MSLKLWVPLLVLGGLTAMPFFPRFSAEAGEVSSASNYKVLEPIRHGNLTIFPVVAPVSHDTSEFLTLDEGVRSGQVVVTEYGNLRPLIRRRQIPAYDESARVNQLVLVNNSNRPLILLAGEIVTGGKQDRVIGKDRIVPAESDPIDLSVFCVEPGRWTAASSGSNFGSMGFAMAQPAVRAKAMADKNQAMVWDEVRKQQQSMAAELAPPAAAVVSGTTSYAKVMENAEVKDKVDAVAAPMERDYRSLIHELRDRRAVGVVVAVNGQIIWADIFASTDLLEKYWPKLVRSYAAEAVVARAKGPRVDVDSAQAFLDNLQGRHESVDSEPGLYRHTEITGEGFKVFELTSLLPKTGFDLHLAKMEE
jgi:ARG and Rhodanese-Phosphatase-superfamily-associated Protein domain